MRCTLLALVVGALTVGGMTAARPEEHGKDNVKILSRKDIAETVDGKKAAATMVEVTLGPGESSAPHRHPGPAFGYVLEGEYEWAIDDNPVKLFKAGDTFYEPTGCLHRVSKNPSTKGKTRILATVLHAQDVKDIVIPEKEKKND
jgi:quercetin dioxygenase-like cupin family protein